MGHRDAAPAPDPAAASARRPARTLLVGLWPLFLAVVLLAPLLVHRGYPLARDLVFVPRQPFTDASIGLGGTAPRAVPLDAVVSVATALLDGAVLARIALLLALVLAGWGMLRLTAPLGTWARLAASGFAVWNPFVVERMALGQWALVAAYATLPWILLAAARFRRTGERGALASVVLWSALASLTPTGGLLALATSLTAGAARTRRTWWLVVTGILLQLPWLVPSFVGGASTTADPAGVAVFAPGSDASGSPALALVGLGGVWDGLSVPATRHSPFALATAIFVVLVLVLGLRRWWRVAGDLAPRAAGLGFGGLLLALLLTTSPGQSALRWAIDTLPGFGLLRDGQKLPGPVRRPRRVGPGRGAGRARRPPDAVRRGSSGLRRHPRGAAADPADPGRGREGLVDGATRHLPARAGTGGGDDRCVAIGHRGGDPAVAFLPELLVGERDDLLRPAGPDARPAGVHLRGPDGGDRDGARGESSGHPDRRRPGRGAPAEALPGFGVGWVVVYPDDPAAGDLDLTGLRQVYASPEIRLYAVPGSAVVPTPTAWRRVVVVAGDLLALLTVLGAGVVGLSAWRRRRGHEAEHHAVLESGHPPQEESC